MFEKRKIMAVLLTSVLSLCSFSSVVQADNNATDSLDAGEIVLEKSFETGEVKYLNYVKSQAAVASIADPNEVYTTNCHIPNGILVENIGTDRSIIGTDDRNRISNTNVFPNRCIACTEITWPNGSVTNGTAFLVNVDQVITAGNCVYRADRGGMAKSIKLWFGRNEDFIPSEPVVATKMVIGGRESNTSADWGVLTLSYPKGGQNGYFGVWLSQTSLVNTFTRLRGYPGGARIYQMWSDAGNILTDSNFRFTYNIDCTAGQFGSPLYVQNQYRVIGVHTTNGTSSNSGTKITERLFTLIGGILPDGGTFTDGNSYTNYTESPFTDGHK